MSVLSSRAGQELLLEVSQPCIPTPQQRKQQTEEPSAAGQKEKQREGTELAPRGRCLVHPWAVPPCLPSLHGGA